MRWYAEQVFPRLMDWSMQSATLTAERQQALGPAHGDVLEVGFGTGLNLPHYPATVRHVTAVEPARLLPQRVGRRIAAARMPVELLALSAERLPFPSGRFDCVVSTWTLCSIADLPSALAEIYRVLKPDGRFLFLEHGRSDRPGTAWWQDVCNPMQRRLACGCNINRPLDRLILQAGFELIRLDRYRLPAVPRLWGEMYRGVASQRAGHQVFRSRSPT
jgi:ubiquinone/menaquinone biosynthesis C-methylase UbiE